MVYIRDRGTEQLGSFDIDSRILKPPRQRWCWYERRLLPLRSALPLRLGNTTSADQIRMLPDGKRLAQHRLYQWRCLLYGEPVSLYKES